MRKTIYFFLPKKKVERFNAYALRLNTSFDNLLNEALSDYYNAVKGSNQRVESCREQLIQIAQIMEIDDRALLFNLTEKKKELNDTSVRFDIDIKLDADVRKLAKAHGFTFTGFVNKAIDYYTFENVDYKTLLEKVRSIIFSNGEELVKIVNA